VAAGGYAQTQRDRLSFDLANGGNIRSYWINSGQYRESFVKATVTFLCNPFQVSLQLGKISFQSAVPDTSSFDLKLDFDIFLLARRKQLCFSSTSFFNRSLQSDTLPVRRVMSVAELTA